MAWEWEVGPRGGAGGGFNLNWDGSWEVSTSRTAGGGMQSSASPSQPSGTATWRRRLGLQRHAPDPPLQRGELLGSHRPAVQHLPGERCGGISWGWRCRSAARPPSFRMPSSPPSGTMPWGRPSTATPGEIGGDAKGQVTQGLTLDLTLIHRLRPDGGGTTSIPCPPPPSPLNLTRFSPPSSREKGPFFLKNAGDFSRWETGGSELFFSRPSGSDQGGPRSPSGGGRLPVGRRHERRAPPIQTGASGLWGRREGWHAFS